VSISGMNYPLFLLSGVKREIPSSPHDPELSTTVTHPAQGLGWAHYWHLPSQRWPNRR